MTIPNAVFAMITAAVPDVTVYDGIIPTKPPLRYAIVYLDDGTLRALAACGQSDSATVRWQVQSIAPDREQASWVATTVRDAIVDATPAVAGWACGPIQHVYSERPGRDETVGVIPMVYKPDLYELLATRA